MVAEGHAVHQKQREGGELRTGSLAQPIRTITELCKLAAEGCDPSAQWRYKLDNSSRHHCLDARGPG